jgi:hypothetical protein
MPLVPASANLSAQMEALVKESESLALGAFVGLILSNQNLDLLGKQAADRGTASRG